jgi:5-bromo-4-chloroindolyl phosphate hydrolysis protein
MWEPRRLTTLWASTASYVDSFNFFLFFLVLNVSFLINVCKGMSLMFYLIFLHFLVISNDFMVRNGLPGTELQFVTLRLWEMRVRFTAVVQEPFRT